MQVTIEEFESLIKMANYYTTRPQDRYNDDLLDHMMKESKRDNEFRAFVKNHYPEALAEWNALQKIGE